MWSYILVAENFLLVSKRKLENQQSAVENQEVITNLHLIQYNFDSM